MKKSNLAIVFNTCQSGLYGLPRRCFSLWQYRESGGPGLSNDWYYLLCFLYRCGYVLYAPGLIKEGTRLLHWIAITFVRKDFIVNTSYNVKLS